MKDLCDHVTLCVYPLSRTVSNTYLTIEEIDIFQTSFSYIFFVRHFIALHAFKHIRCYVNIVIVFLAISYGQIAIVAVMRRFSRLQNFSFSDTADVLCELVYTYGTFGFSSYSLQHFNFSLFFSFFC